MTPSRAHIPTGPGEAIAHGAFAVTDTDRARFDFMAPAAVFAGEDTTGSDTVAAPRLACSEYWKEHIDTTVIGRQARFRRPAEDHELPALLNRPLACGDVHDLAWGIRLAVRADRGLGAESPAPWRAVGLLTAHSREPVGCCMPWNCTCAGYERALASDATSTSSATAAREPEAKIWAKAL